MVALDRKLWRDLTGMWGQLLAIALVIASGVAMFVTQLAAFDSLQLTRDQYYSEQRFANVFSSCVRAPDAVQKQLESIDGVDRVQTRVVLSVNLDVEGVSEPASGRMVGVPTDRSPVLNDVYLRAGRYFQPGDHDCVLLNENFALANDLNPGDHIHATINGRRRELRIIGIALSPEYIYSIRPGDFLPDDKRYGVMWAPDKDVASALDMRGAFNDVAIRLSRGADPDEVTDRVDDVLEKYGGTGAIQRKDQLSAWYIENEITQLRRMGIGLPILFLGVAAFLLNVVLGRIIQTQREQIAVMKAFGYTNLQVGWHYLQLVLVVMLVGSIIGVAVGAVLGEALMHVYADYFYFPELTFRLNPVYPVIGVLVTGLASVLGTLNAVRKAVNLPPAEAMRPEAPPVYKKTLFERIGLARLLSPTTRMIVRAIERRPFKAALSILGIAFAVGIMVAGHSFIEIINHVAYIQFSEVQREDVTVSLAEPRSRRALHDLANMDGVREVEPYRVVAARLRNGHRQRQSAITGVVAHGRLSRVLDKDLNQVTIPDDGVLMSRILAEKLDLHVGDMLTVEVLEGARPTRRVRVVGLVDDFIGVNAWMHIDALNRLMRETDVISGAYLAVDQDKRHDLYRTLKHTPAVLGVTAKSVAKGNFDKTMAEQMLMVTLINIIFSSIVAVAVVYNTARISLSERARELASLRVLGMTRFEASAILLGELAVMTLIALPIGFVLGVWMTQGLLESVQSEIMRIPFVMKPKTFAVSAAVILLASMASALVVRRRIDRLDLVKVLKTRE